jgi:hypothetical protein
MSEGEGALGGRGATLIDDAMFGLLRRRVSVIVASRDAAHQPHLMQALGLRVSPGRDRVTVLLTRSTSRAVLDDIAANGVVAVVVSEPSTHATAQLKGSDAVVEPAAPGDLALVEAHAERFADEIATIGLSRPLAHAILDRAGGDLVAVSFTPTQAFEQTPGPRAGRAIEASPR